MHRISTLPGNEPQEENTFIEQPSAPVIFLTSATSDITCLSTVLKLPNNNKWKKEGDKNVDMMFQDTALGGFAKGQLVYRRLHQIEHLHTLTELL